MQTSFGVQVKLSWYYTPEDAREFQETFNGVCKEEGKVFMVFFWSVNFYGRKTQKGGEKGHNAFYATCSTP